MCVGATNWNGALLLGPLPFDSPPPSLNSPLGSDPNGSLRRVFTFFGFLYRFTPDDGPSPPLSRKGRRPRPSGAPRFGFGRTLFSFVPAQQLALFPFIESRSLTKHATVHRGVPFAGGFLVYQPSTATSRRTGSCWLLSLKALSVTVPLCAVRVPTP